MSRTRLAVPAAAGTAAASRRADAKANGKGWAADRLLAGDTQDSLRRQGARRNLLLQVSGGRKTFQARERRNSGERKQHTPLPPAGGESGRQGGGVVAGPAQAVEEEDAGLGRGRGGAA